MLSLTLILQINYIFFYKLEIKEYYAKHIDTIDAHMCLYYTATVSLRHIDLCASFVRAKQNLKMTKIRSLHSPVKQRKATYD